jgi:hypothetical protein
VAVDDATLAYRRGRFVVALNLSGEAAPLPVRGRVRLSTHPGRADELRPDEGVVVEAR